MTLSKPLSRRQFLNASGLAMASAGLAGCTSASNVDVFRAETAPIFRGSGPAIAPVSPPDPRLQGNLMRNTDNGPLATGLPLQSARLQGIYGAASDGQFTLPAIPYTEIDPRFYRQEVANTFGEQPGTIIVDTGERFLYLIQSKKSAMRYGVGIGREGFAWSGRGVIQWKQKWPRWRPPNEMVARQPHLQQYSIANGGMAPGLENPLGARAMYIFKNNEDTLYRLHGTPEWKSIGKATSSGCVRLINQDVVDLYDRVRNKAQILVI